MFGRIRLRLVGWSVLVVGIMLVLLGAAIYASLARSLMDEVDRGLVASSEGMATSLHEFAETGRLDREGYRGGLFFIVVDATGQALANPQSVALESLPPDLLAHAPPQLRTLDVQGEPVRVYARPVQQAGLPPSVLVVGQSLNPERAALGRLLLTLLVGGGAGLLLALAGAWFLAGRALVPIQQAFGRQQEFVADASHELRTPLTILRSATDLLAQHDDQPLRANRPLFDDIRDEIARMDRLTAALLTLASSDRGELRLSVGRVDLGALAADLARRTGLLAQQRGVALHTRGDGVSAVVEGDPDRLHQVGVILLDNALKHTPPGGEVTLLARREGGDGVLEVLDTGEGIASEHLGRVFDRFYRVDRARSRATGGAGLGLAIARAIVAAHGGHLQLTSRAGCGTRVTVRLPLCPDPASPEDVESPERLRAGVS